MYDKDFLVWIHSRLVELYGEDPNVDYMYKFRAIIRATDHKSITPNIVGEQNESI